MNVMKSVTTTAPDAEQPVLIPVEAYMSRDYARAENEKLWGKVWQAACREEEIPNVGDFVTYDILDESIIVVRTAPNTRNAAAMPTISHLRLFRRRQNSMRSSPESTGASPAPPVYAPSGP